MASNPSDGTTKASVNHEVNPRVTSRIEDIDLSKLESDGTNQQPDLPDPSRLTATRGLARLMGRTFLTHLTREFNNGRHVAALGSGTGIRVMIFGHPKGPTDSLAHFVQHVVSIIQCNLANCACPLCVGPCRQFDLNAVAVVPAST
ncbi:unnamed protein product [Aureobasidium pullulans]|nr:unnamed protein product [Aureobasidium pullulans]